MLRFFNDENNIMLRFFNGENNIMLRFFTDENNFFNFIMYVYIYLLFF